MTELQITGFAIFFIILILTIVWAVMMIHHDINHIWSVEVDIIETLKKYIKECWEEEYKDPKDTMYEGIDGEWHKKDW